VIRNPQEGCWKVRNPNTVRVRVKDYVCPDYWSVQESDSAPKYHVCALK